MPRPALISLRIAILGLIVLIVLLVANLLAPKTHLTPATETPITIGAPFTLIDMNGARVHSTDFADRYLLIYFGFSFCPDVCPTALLRMTQALDLLADLAGAQTAQRVQPIFISVDPARDTPHALRDYVRHFHPRLIGLTGSAAQIDAAKRSFRVYAQRAPDDSSSAGYSIDHSSIIYVMDAQGQFLTHFTHATTPETIANQLAAYLAE